MRIIKVDAIDSTNTFVRNLYRDENIKASVCIVAHKQLIGKGQMGTIWQSNPGENLTCSTFMPISGILTKDQFYISMAVSLAVSDTLKKYNIPKLAIKWPNDILSDRYKVCGILIENMVTNDSVKGSIVGIGLNVNQNEFPGLPLAKSLKQCTGKSYDLDEILSILLKKLTKRFEQLNNNSYDRLKQEYELLLFRKQKPSTFLDINGNSFVGIIQKTTSSGKLRILLEDEILKDFGMKEVKLLY